MGASIGLSAIAMGFVVGGCGATSMMIKAPVAEQCATQGVKSCPELVDGVLLYVDGDKVGAKAKFKVVASQNSPDALKQFAQKLTSAVPGGAAVSGPLGEVALLITEQADQTAPAPPAPPPSTTAVASVDPDDDPEEEEDDTGAATDARFEAARRNHVELALSAPVDPNRLLTETISPLNEEGRGPCEVAQKAATCAKRQQGPLVVTGAVTPPSCRADLFVGASDSTGRVAWFVQTNGAGVAGGAFYVRADQWLTLAVRGVGQNVTPDPLCFVTWSGFRPRMVPASL
jgi:hypothetical protein